MIDVAHFEDLGGIWNWLPAFRAAAESEHLPTAAESLGVTPSAVSRTLRQLEGAIGVPLFERVGRRMRLNEAGRDFLNSVRNSMRQVHSGLARIEATTFTRGMYVAGSGVATLACVVPTLLRMREHIPGFVAHVRTVDTGDMADALLKGEIDFAALSQAITHPELECAHVGEATSGLYCGHTHKLAQSKRVDLSKLGDYAFAAPVADARGNTNEGWPADIPRNVVFHSAQMHVGAEACRAGTLLAILPDYIGRLHHLTRLSTQRIATTPIFGVHRRVLDGGMDYTLLLQGLAHALEEAGGKRTLARRS